MTPAELVDALRVLALWRVAPSVYFWELPWGIQDAVFRAKSPGEDWHSLRPMQRRMFLLFIACAIEGGDL
jgi:hypothetical protein